MKSLELRKLRENFWTDSSRKHIMTTPASLIVNTADDPTTMFNTAGMQPLVPYLMWKQHPTGSTRVYNIQWCVRTVDIDEVGDLSHLTFFEMMWNWSLGDYFKKESITRSREFLTSSDWLWLDPEMISVTIFEWDDDAPLDTDARDIWKWLGVSDHRITPLDKKENRRWPAGVTGPCGPDSEIFYWLWAWRPPIDSNPWNDEENRLEIWNNVFMWYYKDKKSNISEMKSKNVDTGMWFERILMVKQWDIIKRKKSEFEVGTLSAYDIDIFQDFFTQLSTYTILSYTTLIWSTSEWYHSDVSKKLLPSFRIVADHIRTSLLLVNEWLCPSNEWRGYVLRRIVRRWYYHMRKILQESNTGIQKDTLHSMITSLSKSLSKHHTHLEKNIIAVVNVIVDEMLQFQKTLTKWWNKIDKILENHKGSVFSWNDAFLLYDTYGVPVELTSEIVATQWLDIDMIWYEKAMEEAKERSRVGAWNKFAKWVNRADYIVGLPETKFEWYDTYVSDDCSILKDFEIEWTRYLIFDRSPFYAEWWGQTWDSGTVELENWELVHISDVQKYWGVWFHRVA